MPPMPSSLAAHGRPAAALAVAAPALAALALVLALAGCGRSEEGTPVACLEGPRAYARALKEAPGPVALHGETPISECLIENQSGGELAQVGEALVLTATQLNAEARSEPRGEAAVELGYLLGAAQRGAEDTEGIHADLLRRLEVAVRYAPGVQPPSPAFMRAYRKGFDAGRSGG
jgi:hypothetical protein